jgi:hypothetical protein
MPTTEPRERKVIRAAIAVGLIGVVGAFVALVLLAGNDNRPQAGVGPTGTVRRFFTLAAGDDNGYQACRYLTVPEMQRAARAAGETSSCGLGFDSADLTFGGTPYNANRLKALKFTSSQSGSNPVVTVSDGRSSLEFRLVPATAAEVGEFEAPPTHWRIADGASSLIGH